MSFTFSGTYTQNEGDAAAAGTVALTHADGTTTTETLDADGHYSATLSAGDGQVKVVETLDGVPVNTFFVQVTQGATADTGRDLGRVGFSAQSGAIDWTAVIEPAINLEATGEDDTVLNVMASGDGGVVEVRALGAGGAVLISAAGTGGNARLSADGVGGEAYVNAADRAQIGAGDADAAVDVRFDGTDGTVKIIGDKFGWGVAPIAKPEIPASPSAADIAAVLVALGLATQGV